MVGRLLLYYVTVYTYYNPFYPIIINYHYYFMSGILKSRKTLKQITFNNK